MITVDWDSMDFDYRQSASDTRSVGAAVAVVARHLVTRSHITRRNLWCIGHSLGGHLCGLAGKKYRFDRISGEGVYLTIAARNDTAVKSSKSNQIKFI